MGPKTKQLKNSEGAEMVMHIASAVLSEMSFLALLGLTALIFEELCRRGLAEIKGKFHTQGAKQTG